MCLGIFGGELDRGVVFGDRLVGLALVAQN